MGGIIWTDWVTECKTSEDLIINCIRESQTKKIQSVLATRFLTRTTREMMVHSTKFGPTKYYQINFTVQSYHRLVYSLYSRKKDTEP